MCLGICAARLATRRVSRRSLLFARSIRPRFGVVYVVCASVTCSLANVQFVSLNAQRADGTRDRSVSPDATNDVMLRVVCVFARVLCVVFVFCRVFVIFQIDWICKSNRDETLTLTTMRLPRKGKGLHHRGSQLNEKQNTNTQAN